MEAESYSSNDVQKIFRINERFKSPLSLLNAEERGEIPTADRLQRGKVAVRKWASSQLPDIGKKFGFLQNCKKQHIVSCFLSKGGVFKSSVIYNFARTLALNSIRVESKPTSKILIVGLDLQGTITDYALPPINIENLEDAENFERKGLYEFLFERASLDEVIVKTDLPSLYIIPENSSLNKLEKRIRYETRREDFLKSRLIPYLNDFSVICFDNSPNWNSLIENSLVCADTILSPIGCELGSYQALKNHTLNIQDFADATNIDWENYFLLPTMLEKSKISQQIYGSYLNQYPENVLSTPIRRSAIGQEALTLRKSVFEYAPMSPLADDYYEAFKLIWQKIISSEEISNVVKV